MCESVRVVKVSTVTWLPSSVCSVKSVGLSELCANDTVQVIDVDHNDSRNLFHTQTVLEVKSQSCGVQSQKIFCVRGKMPFQSVYCLHTPSDSWRLPSLVAESFSVVDTADASAIATAKKNNASIEQVVVS